MGTTAGTSRPRTPRRSRGPAAVLCGAAVVFGLPAAAPGEVRAQTADQQARADSVEMRLRQRLQALGRGPGVLPDSLRLDSLRLDSLQRVTEGRQALGVPEAAGDSTLAALMEALAGWDATSYRARRAEYEAGRDVFLLHGDTLSRAALLQATGDEVTADSLIRFDQRTEEAEALGTPIWSPATGDPVNARRLVFDTRARAGAAYGARTDYRQGGGTVWNVTGDMPLVTSEVQYGDHARFTSCTLETPHYHFETDKLKIVRGNMLVARPVKLYFADVPVAWLPFIFQSVSQGRSSGILAPRFSVNDIVRTNQGYRRRISNVGYYWAINDYMDATVALDWFSDNYTAVTGNLRYSWRRQFLNGSLTTKRFWRASGGTELSFDTRQRWQMSERTDFNMSARYVTSSSFVRRNSFDPTEVTSQIRSQGGLSHRFDWGSLNVSADRSQSLSDDRVDMNLPRVGLSLKPVTLFEAPQIQASWYNNITWNGSANFSRRTASRPAQEGGFSFSSADGVDMTGNASSSFTVGRFSLRQSVDVRQETVRDVPPFAVGDPLEPPLIVDPVAEVDPGTAAAHLARVPLDLGEGGLRDITATDVGWSTSISYQQPLIGTTTLTPNLSLSGSLLRSDTLDLAQDFVSSPTRMSVGASVKADFYGFYPGVAGFEAIRHKLSPSVTYDWAPEVEPTALQERVFGSRSLRRRSSVSVTLNQTWEGKRPVEEEAGAGEGSADAPGGGTAQDTAGATEAGGGTGAPGVQEAGPATSGGQEGPRRLQQGEIHNILSIRTSAIRYDFVEADETGEFLSGFQTVSLNNTISSDYLPGGVTVNMTHDLFEQGDAAAGGTAGGRRFAPHLSRLNFGFGLNQRSSVVQWLGLAGGGGGDDAPEASAPAADTTTEGGPFGTGVTDEASILPGSDEDPTAGGRGGRVGGVGGGGWSADFRYALSRPRGDRGDVSQILSVNMRMNPTAQWEMSWSTAYDLEATSFNDHRIRLTRDLHRWQAHFDFLKTATGNWSFRFEVSLLDNRDLHFDYQQRSGVEGGLTPGSVR